MHNNAQWDGPARAWLTGLVTVSIACLLVTIFRDQIVSATGSLGQLFRTLHLSRLGFGYESSVGAWWQGTLLLIASIHAFDGYLGHRESDPRLARGWLLLAIVICSLSFDEIGSLHERVPKYLPPGGWLSLLPFALVLGGMALYGIAALLRSPTHRSAGVTILIAFALFGSVAVQEELEFTTRWWGEFDSLRTGLEEGTELTAMLLLVAAAARNTAGLWTKAAVPAEPTLQGLDLLRRPIALSGLLLAPAIGYLSAGLPDKHGRPISWLGAAMFACGALVALRPALRAGCKVSLDWTALALAGGCGVLSAMAVNAHGPRFRLAALTAGCLAVIVLWYLRSRRGGSTMPIAVAVGLCTIVAIAWEFVSPAVTLSVFAAAGALVYAGNAASVASAAASPSVPACGPLSHVMADTTGTFVRPTLDDRR